LNIPEFKNQIQSVDIFSCFETHCDDLDIVCLDNYDCFLKNRSQKSFKKSGGLATFVKHDIVSQFSEIKTDCEYIQWFKLSKDLFKTDEDVIFGAIYVYMYHLRTQDFLTKPILTHFMLKLNI